ncbi:ribosomal L1 domain-containing protein CG13096 [Drosophila ananassae]|nr:ribosomal L1 domain-containing protein CG13096 [Drosophila ananassae]
MVKVQKPQPKSLKKSNSIEGVSKKKNKPEKAAKQPPAAVLEEANNKKGKNAALKKADGAVKAKKELPKQKPEKKQQKGEGKKPLILAPPESPAAAPAANKKSKVKPEKAAKKPLILAPPESPVVPKKETKAKAAAPAPAPAKKAAAKRKAEEPVAQKAAPAPAKKSQKQAAVAEAAKKIAKAAPASEESKKTTKPGKKDAKASKAAEDVKKATKPSADAKPAKETVKAKAQSAASLQKKNKPAQKISKPVKAPKAKKVDNKIKNKPGKKASKKASKAKPPLELTFELQSFDEKKYEQIVSEGNVKKVCQALKDLVAEEVAKKKDIFTDYRYNLQVASYKIASCPKRVVKLALKHSLVNADSDVAIIVPDLQRGAKFDFEPTKQHYEDLLREAGVTQRLTVVPFNQLRNEMGPFEAKRKFLNTYDYLLCDGRISGQASSFLGKFTQKPRNVLHAVRLSKDNDKIAEEVKRALHRTAFRQLAKGDLTTIPVGNHEHSAEQLAENILLVSKQLQQVFPGGLANIRSLYVKIDIVGTSALPLYVSLCAPPAETPYVVGPREQRMLKLKKQANEVLSRFALTKDAEFVKLSGEQVKRKAELRQKKEALLAADAAPKDNDGEDTAVPTKKARKEAASESSKAEPESEEGDAEEDDEEESAGESGEDEDGEDDDDVEGEDDDEDDDDDDDDDDEEDEEEDDDDDDDE